MDTTAKADVETELNDTETTHQTSENFCADDADVTFVSSDKVFFKIHRKNLEPQTGAFPPAEFDTHGEVVQLTETSETLELLFQFVYPRRHPSLEAIPFETLAPLAEAAEKYEVFSAMNICNVRMKHTLPNYAAEIFKYAWCHDYKDILRMAAPPMLDLPLDEVVKKLPAEWVIPWVNYRECWSRAAFSAINAAAPEHYNSTNNHGTTVCIYSSILNNPAVPSCQLRTQASPGACWASLGDKRSRDALLGIYSVIQYTCTAHHCADYSARRNRLEIALNATPDFETFF